MISDLAAVFLFCGLTVLILIPVVTILQSNSFVNNNLYTQSTCQLFKECFIYTFTVLYLIMALIYIFPLDYLPNRCLTWLFSILRLKIDDLNSGSMLLLTTLS